MQFSSYNGNGLHPSKIEDIESKRTLTIIKYFEPHFKLVSF